MKHQWLDFKNGFHVALNGDGAQAASMVLAIGDSTGGPRNRHPDSDQWLFVVSGMGEAIVDEQRVPLRAGSLLLIGRGEAHEICTTGNDPLCTLNFYVPPAYR